MSNESVDGTRRRFLTAATSAVGAVGAAAVVWPFLASLKPSAKAQALGAPVIADISKIEPGMRSTYLWRGQPMWVIRRTPEMLEGMKKITGDLLDPESKAPQQPAYAQNETRAQKPEYMVMKGVCTHLGCSPTFRPDTPAPEIAPDWQGGFFCPCHGSKFDLAGRVYKGVPAPLNMVVPPHRYESDAIVVIGEDPKAA
ncbi:MAG: ubiquinol-cytochrome c reductase iron-sulfur subunit [Nevskia sp.]|jgi:ubiquinol-cytochrome c reductase iron-sulfur subunit|nr:ubiquinol-cytochrome c reductase iron-sulfur subunit [Nevskia sp.]